MPGPNRYDSKGRLRPKRPKKYISGQGWSPLTKAEQASPWVPTAKPTRGERIAERGSRQRIRSRRRAAQRRARTRAQKEAQDSPSILSTWADALKNKPAVKALSPGAKAIASVGKELVENPRPALLGRAGSKKDRDAKPGKPKRNALERQADRNLRAAQRTQQVAQRQYDSARNRQQATRQRSLPRPATSALSKPKGAERRQLTAAKALDQQKQRTRNAKLQKQLVALAGQAGARNNNRRSVGPQTLQEQVNYAKRTVPKFQGKTKTPAAGGGRTPQEVLRGIAAQDAITGAFGRKTGNRGSNISPSNLQVQQGKDLLGRLSVEARVQQASAAIPRDRRRPTQREYLTTRRNELYQLAVQESRRSYEAAEKEGLPEGRLHRNPWALSDSQAPDNETPQQAAERERRVLERLLTGRAGTGFEALDAAKQQELRNDESFLSEFLAVKSFERVGKDTSQFVNHVLDAVGRGDIGTALVRLANDAPWRMVGFTGGPTDERPQYESTLGDQLQIVASLSALKGVASIGKAGAARVDDTARIAAGLKAEGAMNPLSKALVAQSAKIGDETRYGRLAQSIIKVLGKPAVQKAYKIGAPTSVAAGVTTTAASGDLGPILEGTFTANFGKALPTTARALIMGITAPFAWAGNMALTARRGIGAIGNDDPYYSSLGYVTNPVERLWDETVNEMKRMYETYTSKDVERIREATEADYGYITLMSAAYLARPLSIGAIRAAGRKMAQTPAGQAVVKQMRQSKAGQRLGDWRETGETIRRTGIAVGRADVLEQQLRSAVTVPKQRFNGTSGGKRVNRALAKEKKRADSELRRAGEAKAAPQIEAEDIAVMLATKGLTEKSSKEKLRAARDGVPSTSLTYRQLQAAIDNYDDLFGTDQSSQYFGNMMRALRSNDDILTTVRLGRHGEDDDGIPLYQSPKVRDMEVKQQELLLTYGQQYGGDVAVRATQQLDELRARQADELDDARAAEEVNERHISRLAKKLQVSRATASALLTEHRAKKRADKRIQRLEDERQTLEDRRVEIEIILTDPQTNRLTRRAERQRLARIREKLANIEGRQQALFRTRNPKLDRVLKQIDEDQAELKRLREQERPKLASRTRALAERVEGVLDKEDIDAIKAQLENDPDLTAKGLAGKSLLVKKALLTRRLSELRDRFELEERLADELNTNDSIEVIQERLNAEIAERLSDIDAALPGFVEMIRNPRVEGDRPMSVRAQRVLLTATRADARAKVERLLADKASLEQLRMTVNQLDPDMNRKQRRDRARQSSSESKQLLAQIAQRQRDLEKVEIASVRDMDSAKFKALVTQAKQEKRASFDDAELQVFLDELASKVRHVLETEEAMALPTFISHRKATEQAGMTSALDRDVGQATPREQNRSGSLARQGLEARTWKEQVQTYQRELRREKNRNLTKWVAGYGIYEFTIGGKKRKELRRDEFEAAQNYYREQTGRELEDDFLYLDSQFLDNPDEFGAFIDVLAVSKGELQDDLNRAQGTDGDDGTHSFRETRDEEEFSQLDRLTEKISASERSAGRKYVFISRAVAVTMKKQQAELNGLERFFFELNRVSSRIVLGTSLSWMLAQPVAELAILAAQHPIRMWPALAEARKLQRLNGDGWLAAATLARGLPGTDPIVERRTRPTTLTEDAVNYKNLFGIMEKLPGWMVVDQMSRTRRQELGAQMASLGLLGRFDKFKGAWIREAGLLAELDSQLKGMRKAAKAVKGQKDAMEKVSARLAAMDSREEQLRFLMSDEGIDAGMELAKRIDDQLGNWTDLRPGLESAIGQFVFFYPFLRFSLNWALRTYPRDHPVVWTMASLMGVANAEMLERLVNWDPAWPSEWIMAPIFGGDEDSTAPTHLLPVSRYASAGNVATELLLNDAVDPSWALASRVAPPLLTQIALAGFGLDPFGDKIRDEGDPFGEADPSLGTLGGAVLDNFFNLFAPYRDINRFAAQDGLTDGTFTFKGWMDPTADAFRERDPFSLDENSRRTLLRSGGIAGWPLDITDGLKEQEWSRRVARLGATSGSAEYKFEGDDFITIGGERVPFRKWAEQQVADRKEQQDAGLAYPPRPKRHREAVKHYLKIKAENAELSDANKAALGRLIRYAKKHNVELAEDNWLNEELLDRRWQREQETRRDYEEQFGGKKWPGFKQAQRALSVVDDNESQGDGVIRDPSQMRPDERTVEGRKILELSKGDREKEAIKDANKILAESRQRLSKQGYRRLDVSRIGTSQLPEAAQKYERWSRKKRGFDGILGAAREGLLDPETKVEFVPATKKGGEPQLIVKRWRGYDVIGEPSIALVEAHEESTQMSKQDPNRKDTDWGSSLMRLHKDLNALMTPKDYAMRLALDDLAGNVDKLGVETSKKRKRVQELMIKAGGVPSGVPKKYRASVRKWGAWLEKEMKKNGLVQPYNTAIMDGYGVLPKGMSGAEYLAKILQAESGWDESIGTAGNTSYAGAMGLGQFIPGTRQSVLENYGVDAYGDSDQQIHAAAILLSKGGMENYNSLFPNSSDDPVGKGGYHYYYEQDVGKMVVADKQANGKIKGAQRDVKQAIKQLNQAVALFEREAKTAEKQGIPAPNPLGSIGGGKENGEPKAFNGKFMGARKAVSLVLGQPVWGDHMPAADGSFRGGPDESLGGHSMGGQHALSNAYAQDIGTAGGRPEEGEEGLGYDQPTIDRIVKGLQKMGSSIPDNFQLGQDWENEVLPNGYQPLILTSAASGHGDHIHFGMTWVGKGASSGSAGGGGAGSYGGSAPASGGGTSTGNGLSTGGAMGLGMTPEQAVSESINKLRDLRMGGEGMSYEEGGVDSAVTAMAEASKTSTTEDGVKSVAEVMAALPTVTPKKKKVPRFSPENRI